MATDRDTTRVQLELSPKSLERMIRLKARLDATSYAETVKTTLKVTEAVLDRDLYYKNEQGEFVQLVIVA